MGKVNALWMDQNRDLESHDVTGEAAMEAMAEAEGIPESSHHRFDDTMTFCEKCGVRARDTSHLDGCTGTPKAGPMVRVMKVRAR